MQRQLMWWYNNDPGLCKWCDLLSYYRCFLKFLTKCNKKVVSFAHANCAGDGANGNKLPWTELAYISLSLDMHQNGDNNFLFVF